MAEESRPCRLWHGKPNKAGYGTTRWHGKLTLAHRAALMEKLGRQLETGEDALHTCDVKMCVEPAHLYSGTQVENNRDARERRLHGNLKKTHCPKCGSDYTTRPNGQRYCRPCRNAADRRRYAAV